MNLIEAGLKLGRALQNDYLGSGNKALTEKYTKGDADISLDRLRRQP